MRYPTILGCGRLRLPGPRHRARTRAVANDD